MYQNKSRRMPSVIGAIICCSIIISANFYFISAEGVNIPFQAKNSINQKNLDTQLILSPLGKQKGSTLYVGGNGPDNYSSIQNAIDNASDGDTVFVYDDSSPYYENIVVEKNITLMGEQQDNTIIDGGNNDTTVTIGNGMVEFRSFTVQNGNYYGIYINNAHGVSIIQNTIKNNEDAGIYGSSAIDCVLKNNTINNNEIGIKLDQYSRRCNIFNNTIYNHSTRGVFLMHSYENIVENCSISNNDWGMAVHYCNNTIISNNFIVNNSVYGIRLKESTENNINYNEIFYNEEGIKLFEQSSNNIINGNTIKTITNIHPIAIDDSASTPMNISVNINITSNDYDRDGRINISSVSIQSGPYHGTLNSTSGIVSYTSNAGYNGSDMFTYTVKDEKNTISNEATVNIMVISDDLGDKIGQQQTTQDRSLPIYSDWWMAQSIRFQAGTLTKISLHLKKTGNPPGSIQVDIHEENISGDIVYSSSQPASNVNTTYDWIYFDNSDFIVDQSLQYYIVAHTISGNTVNCYNWGHSNTDVYALGLAFASDNYGSNWNPLNNSDFCFKIYKAAGVEPVSSNDTYKTAIGTTLSVSSPGVLGNDHDNDEAPYPINAILQNPVSHGSLSFNPDGSFVYDPGNFTGIDEFTYIASDGENNASIATVTINVTNMKRCCINIPYSGSQSANNYFYHNNFISGTFNPFVSDVYVNTWDNTSLDSFGGNYWSNYNEPSEGAVDSDLNEIYDQPIDINGGSNQDNYPLTHLWKSYDPLANFSWIPIGPATDLLIQFTDLSTDAGYGKISKWNWDFDDGNTSTDQNPIHQYDLIGVYNVTVVIIDDDGLTDLIFKLVIVSASPPVANFTWAPSNPNTMDIINFTDTSTDDGDVVSWMWDFDDGNTSTDQNPNHSYNDNGSYMVQLTVGDDDGAIDVIVKQVNVSNVAPFTQNDSAHTYENTSIWIDVLGNDNDSDGYLNYSSLTVIYLPIWGNTNVNNSTGEIQYTPNTGFYGNDSFVYRVADDDAAFSNATVTITVVHINRLPIAVNDNYSAVEDEFLNISAPGVLCNDSDPDDGPSDLSAEIVSNTSHGDISLNSNGSFSYDPDNNFYGVDSFTYQASDGLNYSNIATVTINISNINDAPVAFNDSYYMLEDSIFNNLSVGVLDNDIDVDNLSTDLTAELVENVSNGTISFNSNGSFIYEPNDNSTGIDSFTYHVSDGMYFSNNATAAITVDNVNDPPIAYNDSYWIMEDNTLIVSSPGVLGNDTDIDSSVLSAIRISNTAHGNLYFNSDGSFEYIPNIDFYGFDSFAYQAYDGINGSNIAIVTIHVLSVNEPPIAYDDSYNTTEDAWLNITGLGVLGNDTDSDSGPDPLTAVLTGNVSHGSLTLNSDGSFTYLPVENYTGWDNFTYYAFDGVNYSNNATVSIIINNVNDPPVAVDNLYSIDEDTTLSVNAPGVLSNDFDAESEVADLQAFNLTTVSNGTFTFYTNGSFEYVPSYNFHGIVKFDYHAFDGLNYSNTATVTIIVNSVNDIPIAGNDSYATTKNTNLSISAPGILGNDSDPDNGPENLSAVLFSDPLVGSINLSANGSFVYTPHSGFYGNDSFTYKAFDGQNYSNEAVVNITVYYINFPPVANNDYYFTYVNQSLNVSSPGFLGNDFDPDNGPDNLSATLITNVSNGTLIFNSTGWFNYMPNTNYTGNDSFVYNAYDGENYSQNATVAITMLEANIPPVAYNDSYYTLKNNDLFIFSPGVLGNDTDPDGSPSNLTAELVVNASHGFLSLYSNGSFYYDLNDDWTGMDMFTYQAYDGLNYSNIATVTITVVDENLMPVAVNDSYSTNEDAWLNITAPGVLSNDFDTDAGPDSLTMTLVNNVSNGNLFWHDNGSFEYKPNENYSGLDIFTYQAYDGLNYSNIATVTLTVGSGNQAPVTVNDSYNVSEDSWLNVMIPGVLSNDFDPDMGPNPLTVALVDDASNGNLSFHINGSFEYLPYENYSGMDSFTYQAFDGESYSNLTIVTINIAEVNDPPVAINDSATTLVNNSVVINVTANDYDVDGSINSSTVTVVGLGPSNGTAVVDIVTGNVNYTPNPGFIGIDLFKYTVEDNLGTVSDEATVTVNVVNDFLDVDQSIFDRGLPIRHAADGDWAGAQSFKPNFDTLSRVELYTRTFGTPEFDFTVEFREDDPQGTLIDTVVFTPGEIPSNWGWLNVDFNNINVDVNTTYFIVTQPAPSGVTTSFGYEWGYAFGDQYADGSFWFTRDGGSLWRDLPLLYEFTFKTYGVVE